METGKLPPNLHLTKPIDVQAFQCGRIKVPTEIIQYKPSSGRIGMRLLFRADVSNTF